MNSVIELHDSELLSMDTDRGIVAMKAWVHRSASDPLAEGSEGGTQLVHFHFESMAVSGDSIDLPAAIYDGHLKMAATTFRNIIPLPYSCMGPVSLAIYLTEEPLIFSGSNLSIEAIGEFNFVQYFPG